MKKTLLVTLVSLFFSMASFASSYEIKGLLLSPEFKSLESTLHSQNFTLSKIVDTDAEKGLSPRCICNNYKLTFSKLVSAGNIVEVEYKVTAEMFFQEDQNGDVTETLMVTIEEI